VLFLGGTLRVAFAGSYAPYRGKEWSKDEERDVSIKLCKGSAKDERLKPSAIPNGRRCCRLPSLHSTL
jgi:hypothetical protein